MSEIELINQFLIWSQQQEFRDILYPILIQTFQHRESVLEPLGIIAADSLKCAQVG